MKPVAWINDENIVAVGECPKDFIHSWKPLYTAPPTIQTRVKYGNPDTLETGWITIETPAPKDLSDEEILEIYHDVYVKHHNDGIDFARAILKKASEK